MQNLYLFEDPFILVYIYIYIYPEQEKHIIHLDSNLKARDLYSDYRYLITFFYLWYKAESIGNPVKLKY